MPIFRLARRFAALLLPFVLASCGGGGEEEGRVQRDLPEAAVSCPGADLARLQTVVYVAPDGIAGDNCGATVATACKSIAKGIRRCTRSGCAVAVRYGLYDSSETIALVDGVSVYGSCRFGDEPDLHYRTVIAAKPAAGEAAIAAANLGTTTVLSNIVVLGKNETTPGEASVGMLVRSSRGLSLSGVTLAAGRGGDGAAGSTVSADPGGNGTQPGPNANAGGEGGASCPGKPQPWPGSGGPGRELNFPEIQTCTFDCDCSPAPARQAPDFYAGRDSGAAHGGSGGGIGGAGLQCNPHAATDPGGGPAGAPGELGDCGMLPGTPSTATVGLAKFNAGRWVASRGNPGGEGGSGSGGGGGGAGGYAVQHKFLGDTFRYHGLPGGGGGGGCGGPGGQGGQQGGASIALVLINAGMAELSDTANLIPGPGGQGGTGGTGAPGGPGGKGASGAITTQIHFQAGSFQVAAPAFGGQGGDGGPGGAGAGGAGGNGGPSMAIAAVGAVPDPGNFFRYSTLPGSAGRRGSGINNPAVAGSANSQCRSADGQDGLGGAGDAVVRFEGED
ncbi:hypothetical protein [Noviherbaspirillum pedocola]|uniref:PE-PGRS family protein n=1 Tax=Noviherbaspirillum pedocola TaxID=2801341 RepID=A0A934W8F5_9BURK|nr:hypothetical protein [Noviherbaspirillum pedocola]MBK4737515.1 hypothetical protein [Noviherbaspirillum pedocola]